MYNLFNAVRFKKLFLKHTIENYRNYILATIVLFGILAIYYFSFVIGNESKTSGLRITGLIVFYLFAGCIFTSSMFSDFSRKRQAIASLTLPASHFEKFLVGWVYSFLIFTAVYILTYGAVDSALIPFSTAKDKRSLTTLILEEGFPLVMFLYYTFLHSIMIYGAFRFKSAHFIKTATVLFIVVAVLCLSHSWFLESLISKELGFTLPLRNEFSIITNGTTVFYYVQLDVFENLIYTSLVSVGVAITVWLAAYYSLQEKEI